MAGYIYEALDYGFFLAPFYETHEEKNNHLSPSETGTGEKKSVDPKFDIAA